MEESKIEKKEPAIAEHINIKVVSGVSIGKTAIDIRHMPKDAL